MSEEKKGIDHRAVDSLSVAPGGPAKEKDEDRSSRKSDAGQDESIKERLNRNPESRQARLDTALDESMDASDPPSGTQPVHSHKPAPSSGYDDDAERKRAADKRP